MAWATSVFTGDKKNSMVRAHNSETFTNDRIGMMDSPFGADVIGGTGLLL